MRRLKTSATDRRSDLIPRMRGGVLLSDLVQIQLGVNLSRRHRLMAKQLLHHPQVRPTLQQMHRIGVTKGVGADALGESSEARVVLQHRIGSLPKEAPTVV